MNAASLIRLIALGAIWGASFLFMRVAAPAFGAPSLIGVRLGLAALFLFAVALVTARALPWRENWLRYSVIGVVNSAAPFMLFAYSATTLPASILSIFNSLAPIFGAAVSAVWLKTPVTPRLAAGLAAGVAGVGVLTFDHIAHVKLDADPVALALAFAAATGAPFLYGVAATYIKKTASGGDAFNNAHGSMWASALLTAPFAALFAPAAPPVAIDWAAAAALGLLSTGAAYLLYFKLIADLGAPKAMTVSFLIPVFGVLWGVVFLGERIDWSLALGGGLIILGMALCLGFRLSPFGRKPAAAS